MKAISLANGHFLHLTRIHKRIILLFLGGFLVGYIFTWLFKDSLYESLLSLYNTTVEQLPSLAISKEELAFYCFKRHSSSLLFLFFFAMTNVWTLYYGVFTLYTGFSHGVLFAFCIILHHIGGFLEYLCFLFPQVLLLLPLYLFFINNYCHFHNACFSKENANSSLFTTLFLTQKRQLLLRQLPVLFLGLIVLLFCSLLEGYLNLSLVKLYHFHP